MMKRLFWFTLGVVAGAYGVLEGKKKASEVAENLTPQAIARHLFDAVKSLARRAVARFNGETREPPPSVL